MKDAAAAAGIVPVRIGRRVGVGMAAETGGIRTQLPVEEVLTALAPEASEKLRAALTSGCCTHFYVAEGHCGSGGCGSGKCCFHVVSSACGIDQYECLDFPCSKGNFSTGC